MGLSRNLEDQRIAEKREKPEDIVATLRQIGAFVDHYNNHRYHRSLNNLPPADIYHGRGAEILKMREEIKKQTIRKRRLQNQAAATYTETEPEPPFQNGPRSPKNPDDGQA